MTLFVNEAHLMEVALFAVKAHHGQTRKHSDEPYVCHPLRVAQLVAEIEYPDEPLRLVMMRAAILHDVIEDTDYGPEDIEAIAGTAVREMVEELTQKMSLPKEERKAKMLDELPQKSLGARIVKLADRIDNVSDLESMPEPFIARYVPESRHLLAQLEGTHRDLEARLGSILDRFD